MLGNIGGPEKAEWPVGTVMMRIDDVNPGTLLGYGTWEITLQGRFPLGAGAGYTLGNEGGEAAHKLTINEMPRHRFELFSNTFSWGRVGSYESPVKADAAVASAGYPTTNSLITDQVAHRYTNYGGGDAAHNNMPPYRVVSYWLRTA